MGHAAESHYEIPFPTRWIDNEGEVHVDMFPRDVQNQREGNAVNGPLPMELEGPDIANGQTANPYVGLYIVSIIDTFAPIVAFGCGYFNIYPSLLNGGFQNGKDESITNALFALSYLLQTTMGVLLFLRMFTSILNCNSMPNCLHRYDVFSILLFLLKIFLLISTVILWGETASDTDDVDGFISSNVETVLLIVWRLFAFAIVDMSRKMIRTQG